MVERRNDDLDAAFGEAASVNDNHLPRTRKTRRKASGDRDRIRRKAFRVLALLADLPAGERLAVLRAAERLNRA
jgi:hypothetical protein